MDDVVCGEGNMVLAMGAKWSLMLSRAFANQACGDKEVLHHNLTVLYLPAKIDGNFWWYWRFCCKICAGIKPWSKMLFTSAIRAMVGVSIASLPIWLTKITSQICPNYQPNFQFLSRIPTCILYQRVTSLTSTCRLCDVIECHFFDT